MPPLILIPAGIEAIELGEAAYAAWRIYRLARAAQAAARAAEDLKLVVQVANIALQSRAAVKGCATCPKEAIPCFSTPKKGTDAEMDRQLKEQQDAINNMSPDELLDNLAKNRDDFGRIVRPADDAAIRAQERASAEALKRRQLQREYSQTRPVAQAEVDAAQDAASYMKDKQILHTPDLAAGGSGKVSPIPGGASENQSIGAQWNTKGGGDKTRASALEQEAANAKARGDKKMDVELERCKATS